MNCVLRMLRDGWRKLFSTPDLDVRNRGFESYASAHAVGSLRGRGACGGEPRVKIEQEGVDNEETNGKENS
jgi:hypothetical protein